MVAAVHMVRCQVSCDPNTVAVCCLPVLIYFKLLMEYFLSLHDELLDLLDLSCSLLTEIFIVY